MRFRTSAAAAVSVLAAGLGVAACSPASSGASSSVPAPSGSPVQSGTASAAPAAAQSAGTASGSGAGTGSSGSGANASGAGSGGKCQPADLRVTLGASTPATAGSGNSYLKVDLTNVSSASCTMDGYPGVNLVGAARGQGNYQWPLERSTAAQPSLVTLAPGAVAHFTMSYLAGNDASQNIDVDEIIITPPDDTTQTNVTWKQSVTLQDAATHPGTWIEPIQAGA